MRGDRPLHFCGIRGKDLFTPHARGSTTSSKAYSVPEPVYPACAGIDPNSCRQKAGTTCLPRMRGDRPGFLVPVDTEFRFTPHARGSTAEEAGLDLSYGVYPACAGIDRGTFGRIILSNGLPRMRGDRPSRYGLRHMV